MEFGIWIGWMLVKRLSVFWSVSRLFLGCFGVLFYFGLLIVLSKMVLVFWYVFKVEEGIGFCVMLIFVLLKGWDLILNVWLYFFVIVFNIWSLEVIIFGLILLLVKEVIL